MTENDYAPNCPGDEIEEKVFIIKLRTRIQNLEAKVAILEKFLAVKERDYKHGLPDSWSVEDREISWQAHLDGK